MRTTATEQPYRRAPREASGSEGDAKKPFCDFPQPGRRRAPAKNSRMKSFLSAPSPADTRGHWIRPRRVSAEQDGAVSRTSPDSLCSCLFSRHLIAPASQWLCAHAARMPSKGHATVVHSEQPSSARAHLNTRANAGSISGGFQLSDGLRTCAGLSSSHFKVEKSEETFLTWPLCGRKQGNRGSLPSQPGAFNDGIAAEGPGQSRRL